MQTPEFTEVTKMGVSMRNECLAFLKGVSALISAFRCKFLYTEQLTNMIQERMNANVRLNKSKPLAKTVILDVDS